MKLRVLLLSDTPVFGQSVLRCLGSGGISSDVWCTTRVSPIRLSRYCRRYRYVSRQQLLDTSHDGIDRINRACERHGLDAVVPSDMPTAIALAEIQDRLTASLGAYPLPDPDTLMLVDDKWRFSRFMSEHGIPQSPTRLLERVEDAAGLDLEYPLIVKPVIGDGGVGIHRVDTLEDLEAGIRRGDDTLPLLVQCFIPGRDVDLSLLADRGRMVAYTIQQATGAKEWREFLEDEEIADVGRQIVEGSNYHGVMHLDMRRDERDGSLVVIECNPRFWGTIEMSLWVGVNFPALGLELLHGRHVGLQRARHLGPCQATGLAPRRMLRALLRGRLSPAELTPSSREAWFQNLADPLPELVERVRRSFRSS